MWEAILQPLFEEGARRAARYVEEIGKRHVAPLTSDVERLELLAAPLQQEPCDPVAVLAQLDEIGSPATVASTGPRYFGFVTGGVLPAAMVAGWLATAWDQNAGLQVLSPLGAKLEDITTGWLLDLLGLPASCGAGFVTGATMGNFTALAAARHAIFQRAGWDVEEQGLFGAPPITVVVGGEVHVALLKALALLGLGRATVIRAPADDQGRIRVATLPALNVRTILCLQAGNVNTGAFDPAVELCGRAREAGAWVHVDGAFGLWAAASPQRAQLAAGYGEADSWATDCHKWLNVPHDSGLAFVRNAEYLRAATGVRAAYLQEAGTRQPCHYTPEGSRRARAIEIWAALRSLGRRGLAELIERDCQLATRFADGLRGAGFEILNDVVLNQVLVSFGEPERTRRIIAEIQQEGTCWCGGTVWQGRTAMRISVSSWATTADDVDRSLAAILGIARASTTKA